MRPYPRTARNGPGYCDSCRAPVLWTLTTASRREMAVDRPVNADGNQAVRTDPDGVVWTRQLTRARPRPEWDEALHMPHIATCPNAAPRPGPPRRRSAPTRLVRRTPWRSP
jgi:hypothetical protein